MAEEQISGENCLFLLLIKSLSSKVSSQQRGKGRGYAVHLSPCVCVSTYISVSSACLLFHYLQAASFTLPANQLHNT